MEAMMETKAAGSIQKAAAKKDKPKSIKGWIADYGKVIEQALPKVMTPERFARICTSAVSKNPKLGQCTPESFLGAMLTAAQLGLEPNTVLGQAWLIPYWNSKKNIFECQFQMGYKGLITLAYRSGMVATVDAQEVHENDTFDYELGIEPKLIHKPAQSNRGDVIAYYGIWRTKDGMYGFAVMSMEDIKEHRAKYSKAKGVSPWNTNFDAMAKKTVLTKALKYAPMSSEFQRETATDATVRLFDPKAEEQDMLDLEPEYVFDEETGEVIENAG